MAKVVTYKHTLFQKISVMKCIKMVKLLQFGWMETAQRKSTKKVMNFIKSYKTWELIY